MAPHQNDIEPKIIIKTLIAPRAGFEPATLRLTAECSTVELSRNCKLQITYNVNIYKKSR